MQHRYVELEREEIPCNNCGGDDVVLLLEGRDRLQGKGGTFSLVRCGRCGLIYLNPRPTQEEMSRYYPKEYDRYRPAIEDEPSGLKRWLLRYGIQKRCRAITARKKGGRLLDVGCATGIFLAEMRRHGQWELHGVETTREAVAYARTRFGLDIFIGELEEAGYPDRYFDVITLWDVLEHLPDPRFTLLEIRRIMKPDGILLLQVPDVNSLEARLFGRFWIGLDIPRHLYLFSKQTLKPLLQQAGFEAREIEYFSGGYHTFILSSRFFLEEKMKMGWIREAVTHVLDSFAVRLFLFPYFSLVRRLRKGPVMLVVAEPNRGSKRADVRGSQ